MVRRILHGAINQLNLVYNLLYFQGQFDRDGRSATLLESARRRVKAVALVYEHLERTGNYDRVNLAGYCRSLLAGAMAAAQGLKKKINLKTKIAAVSVDAATAASCGLIVGELLDNALRHAFPDGRRAEIFFALQSGRGAALAITVRDNGVGLPPEVQWRQAGSMGRFLVNTLSESLGGELTVDVHQGTSFQLRWPAAPRGGAKKAAPRQERGMK